MDAKQRRQHMADLFKSGLTLQQIGERYGICRERVRQLIKKEGITRKDGGAFLRAQVKENNRLRRLEENILNKYGISRKKWIRHKNNGDIAAFRRQRQNAKDRGIEWKLKFVEWLEIWEVSGKIKKRGRTNGLYVMARFGDKGAYEVGNVAIVTCNSNIAEYWHITRHERKVNPKSYR